MGNSEFLYDVYFFTMTRINSTIGKLDFLYSNTNDILSRQGKYCCFHHNTDILRQTLQDTKFSLICNIVCRQF